MAKRTKSFTPVNLVLIEGHAGNDPDYFESDAFKKASFTLYSTRRWLQDGKAREATTRITVVAWGAQAEFVRAHVTKGGAYEVRGSLVERVWQDKDSGRNRSALSIRLDDLHFRGRPPISEEADVAVAGEEE